MVQLGGTLHILAGTYSESITVSKAGTQAAPIRIVGEGAVLSNGGSGAFIVNNSQWVTFEGFTILGYTLLDFEVRQSHYLTFRNNSLEYTFAAIRIKDGVSHILIENNEMYQTYPAGSTWTALKGSKYEGAGVYASTGGQGMYFIRGNHFHDSMNGVYFSDADAGNWMNANIFINGNIFRNIVDDPFEPEGDSFNLHFYRNTLINTHRMASVVPNPTCIGPIFVYGNYQKNTLDPTGEASTGRKNSVIKMNTSTGPCPNGVWVFNNTASANVAGTNFYGVDLLNSSVQNYQMLNNVLVTEKNAYSGTPVFTNALSDYNLSLKPFGYAETHGLQGDPLLNPDGTLQPTSPAKGRSTPVNIADYFASPGIVLAGADLGAFINFPSPKYVVPPGGAPAGFPANVSRWPDAPVPATSVPTFTPVVLPSLTSTPSQVPTQTATNSPTSTVIPTLIQPTITPTAIIPATATSVPTFTAVVLPSLSPTPSQVPTQAATTTPISTAIPALTQPAITPTLVTPADTVSKTSDNTDSAFVYSPNAWQTVSTKKAYNGSYQEATQDGSFATFPFTGKSFSILYKAGVTFSKLNVYVDDVLVATIDQKSSKTIYQKRWDYPGQLAYGNHTLKLVLKVTSSTIYRGSLDAVIVR